MVFSVNFIFNDIYLNGETHIEKLIWKSYSLKRGENVTKQEKFFAKYPLNIRSKKNWRINKTMLFLGLNYRKNPVLSGMVL